MLFSDVILRQSEEVYRISVCFPLFYLLNNVQLSGEECRTRLNDLTQPKEWRSRIQITLSWLSSMAFGEADEPPIRLAASNSHANIAIRSTPTVSPFEEQISGYFQIVALSKLRH